MGLLVVKNLKEITIIDGIAIIIIVVYHSVQMFDTSDAIFLQSTLHISQMGLFLFTFMAGYKLMINHSNELEDRQFLKRYFVKRFIRLYKPYLGYSVIIFIPELILIYIATSFFKLNFTGITLFWNSLNIEGFLNLLAGDNFIAQHLWYLFALIIITSVCFIILYWTNIKCLYWFAFVVYLSNILGLSPNIPYIDGRTILYMPTFVFGICWAQYEKRLDIKKALIFLSVSFLILIVQIISHKHILDSPHYMITYGFIFPCLMILLSPVFTKIKYINNILYFCGEYSFQIYLFHEPIILPSLERFIVDVIKINYSIIPYILSILALLMSVYAYNICKKAKLNTLFE